MTHTVLVSLPLADLPTGSMQPCRAGDREILLCRSRDGIFAIDNICTHAFARLSEGRLRGTRIICPLHGASFDIKDGRVLGAPATEPLAVYEVRVGNATIDVMAMPPANNTREPTGKP